MNEKLDTIIKYMQSKTTTFSVREITEITGMLEVLKETPETKTDKKAEK
jgi:hypothetical protein